MITPATVSALNAPPRRASEADAPVIVHGERQDTTQTPVRDFIADIRKHFPEARVTYLKGPSGTGVERGEAGDDGVPVTWP